MQSFLRRFQSTSISIWNSYTEEGRCARATADPPASSSRRALHSRSCRHCAPASAVRRLFTMRALEARSHGNNQWHHQKLQPESRRPHLLAHARGLEIGRAALQKLDADYVEVRLSPAAVPCRVAPHGGRRRCAARPDFVSAASRGAPLSKQPQPPRPHPSSEQNGMQSWVGRESIRSHGIEG